LAAYNHFAMALIGAVIVVAVWLTRISGRHTLVMPSAALMLGGIIVGLALPQFGSSLDPVADPQPWELAAEVCVIISLFATGLQIDHWRRTTWWRTGALLVIGMPITIGLLAWAGAALAGLPLAAALLLGAVLAPTDPVLAADVQVGAPQEGKEDEVRFLLTTEAGMNDGLAFPFVWLAISVAIAGGISADLVERWAVDDLLKKIVMGGAAGVALGWLVGQALFRWSHRAAMSAVAADVVVLGAVFLIYGGTELAGGYGFIAAFVGGLMVRRAGEDSPSQVELFEFAGSLERGLTALLLVAGGVALGLMLPYVTLGHVGVALLALLVIRPLAGFLSLLPFRMPRHDRAIVAGFGVRGIGSIYYLAFAASKVTFDGIYPVWAIVLLTIFGSTLLHGLTAGRVMAHLDRRRPIKDRAASDRRGPS
jgi:NhaP-type Na+/H+ or K+/H+ antiporter